MTWHGVTLHGVIKCIKCGMRYVSTLGYRAVANIELIYRSKWGCVAIWQTSLPLVRLVYIITMYKNAVSDKWWFVILRSLQSLGFVLNIKYLSSKVLYIGKICTLRYHMLFNFCYLKCVVINHQPRDLLSSRKVYTTALVTNKHMLWLSSSLRNLSIDKHDCFKNSTPE